MTDYKVQLDVYNGPLDLLLYLIRRDELDIYEIPIAHITEQYCRYIEILQTVDPNVAGDFLVMAAMLMEIKSRTLLPRPVNEQGEEDDLGDPRMELVRQLLEYKKYKDASMQLGSAAADQARRWPRFPAKLPKQGPGEVDLEDVQIWDLVAAFNKVLQSIGAGPAVHDVVFDDTPISLHAADILDQLKRDEDQRMLFEEIFIGRRRAEMIGLFLALLELMRQQRVQIAQERPFGAIIIVLLSADPISVGDEWESRTEEASEEPSAGVAEAVEVEEEEETQEDEEEWKGVGDDDEEDDDEERFDELDKIKTDVDIEAILKRGAGDNQSDE